jgi:hypothetical protein
MSTKIYASQDWVEEKLSDVTATAVPSAVNTALDQAKANGEFKGEPGDDYILTEADKTEIAGLAAEMVDVPKSSGGVYVLDDGETIEDVPADVDVAIDPNGIVDAFMPLTFTGAVNATYDGSEEVTVEIPQGGGSEDIIVDEVVLASGTITAKGESAENIDTGVTVADLKKYKMFFVGATAASNTSLNNLYIRFSGGKSILRINNERGGWSVFAFLNDTKTMFMSVAGQRGNISLDPHFVRKASNNTWQNNDYGVGGSAATPMAIFVLDNVPDDAHVFIMPSAVYSIDVSWKVVGVLR